MRRALRRARRIAMVCVLVLGAEPALGLVWPLPDALLDAQDASRLVLARDGSVLRVTVDAKGERCIPVPLADVSPHVIDALIAAEDRRFRDHDGVDVLAVGRAALGNLTAGRVESGASTITMQLARMIEPRPRTLGSKVVEALRARQIERRMTKDEILAAYLDRAPFGGTTRGIEAAARRWFGKSARDLNVSESATLVAMLPAPTARAPDLGGADRLSAARREVLSRMERAGRIDAARVLAAASMPLPTTRRRWPYRAPHACDMILSVRDRAVVRTSIDLDVQTRVEEIARAHDDRGVDGVAVVVLDRESGALRAMLGSRDYRTHPLNAATCRRSAGSTLKPFVYALALQSGVVGPDGLVRDTELTFDDYAPRNFEGELRGAMRASEALAASRNLPAIRLLHAVGTERFADALRELGIRTPPHALHVDAALGTLSVSPLELARAYQRLAGTEDVAGLSQRVRDQVLAALSSSPSAATPAGAGSVAWKTGTSSGRRDAWCAGITDEHVIVVWYGRLDGAPAPEMVGGRAAADLLGALVGAL